MAFELKNQLRWMNYLAPLAVLVMAIVVRFSSLDSQMAPIDDVGVAYTILQQDEVYQPEMIRYRIYNKWHEQHDSFVFQYLRDLDEKGELESQLPVLRQLFKLVIIPQTWTYAPLQYVFTSVLLDDSQTYRETLFWGRLPSAVFSVLGLLLLIPFFRMFSRIHGPAGEILEATHSQWLIPLTACLIFMGLSWESILYSAHMSSYAIGILGAIITCYAFVRAVREPLTWKCGWVTGFLLAIAFYMSYQLLFFLPAFFSLWVLAHWSTIKERSIDILKPGLAGVIVVLAFAPAYVLFLSTRTERGQVWAFSYPKYRFDIGHVDGFGGKLAYLWDFFADNTFRMFRFITTVVPQEHVMFHALGLIFFALFVLGLVTLMRSKLDYKRYFGWFSLLVLLTFIVLTVMGKTTVAPTRHSLVLLPLVAIPMANAVGWLFQQLFERTDWSTGFVSVPLLCLLSVMWMDTVVAVKSCRSDLYSDEFVAAQVEQHNPKYIMTRNENVVLMDVLNDWERVFPYTANRKPVLFINPDSTNATDMVLGLNLDMEKGLEVHELPYPYSNQQTLSSDRVNCTFDVTNEAFVITNFMVITSCR